VYRDRMQDFDLSFKNLLLVQYLSQILVFRSQDVGILKMILTTSARLLENHFSK